MKIVALTAAGIPLAVIIATFATSRFTHSTFNSTLSLECSIHKIAPSYCLYLLRTDLHTFRIFLTRRNY